MSTAATVYRSDILGEEVHRYVLPSGLRVLVHPKPGYLKKFAVLSANYGSVDSRFVDPETGELRDMPAGIAHFLEHKLFELKEGDAFDAFSRQGASGNAATSFRTTSFFFSCSEYFAKNLRTLVSLVTSASFTAAAVEKERGIIEQEIRMYEDNPDWRIFMNLVEGLYRDHPVRIDITGSKESIARIRYQDLLSCHRWFYHPENLCLVVCGDLDSERIVATVHRALGAGRNEGAAERIDIDEPRRVLRNRIDVELPVVRSRLLIGFKDPWVPVHGRDHQRRDLVTAILLDLMFGSSSHTWQRLYEEDVIDDSFYATYAGEEDFGFVTLGGEVDEPDRVRRRLMREIRKFGKKGFSAEDFGRVVHKMIGRFVGGLDSTEGTAFMLLSSEFRGVDPFVIPTLLRTITRDEIMERHARLFGDRNHCTSIGRKGKGRSRLV